MMKRLLILTHRWLGLVLGLAFVVWFASGIAMIYAGDMPRLTAQEKLAHLPALDLGRTALAPGQAAALLGAGDAAGVPVLGTYLGRPAYRFSGDGSIVFADDGARAPPLDDAAARRVAEQFLGAVSLPLEGARRLEQPDQWTLSLRAQLPLLKFTVGDAAGTELYVSLRSREVVQATTRAERGLAWVAAIPHWLYFTALRQHAKLWNAIVIGLSAVGCLLAALGVALIFTQWRRTRPFDLRRAIVYRGALRWHYLSGALCGVFGLTWVFSGLLSMEPFRWTRVPEMSISPELLAGGRTELSSFDRVDFRALSARAGQPIKEVRFVRVPGTHLLELAGASGTVRLDADTLEPRDHPVDTAVLLDRVRAALPQAPILAHTLLQHHDDYYYSRDGDARLPVLRLQLGDPLQTWLYIDPESSRIVANLHRYSRIERWLFNGLHSLDFRFWYSKRPLWDVVVITLLLGGLATSSIGFYCGVRRLIR